MSILSFVTVYGRIYCLQLDRVGMILNIFRFYRDAVVQQGTLPIYSSHITVSVVANVLLLHQIDAKVVVLYDLFLDSLAPVSAPLPLLLRGPCSSRQTVNEQDNLNNAYGRMIYGDSWTFLVPDLICDVDNGMLWRIFLDLEIKLLCLAIMHRVILERRPISMISRAMDVLVASYSQWVILGNALAGGNRRASEKSQNTDIQHTVSSEEPARNTGNSEKNFAQVYTSDSQKSIERDMESETLDNASTSAAIKASLPSGSNFNGDANLKNLRHEKSFSCDSQDIKDREVTRNVGGQTSGVNLEQSPLESGVEYNNNPAEASTSTQMGSQHVRAAISPDEIYHFVLVDVEDEMGVDPSYLVSIIVEFLQSVSKEKLKVHPNVYVMTIQLLARNNPYAELGLFIINKKLPCNY